MKFWSRKLKVLATLVAVVVSIVAVAIYLVYPSSKNMDKLARTESALQVAFPVQMSIENAKAAFRANGMEFGESSDNQPHRTMTAGGIKLLPGTGETILFGKTNIGAFEFPCGYEVQVELYFDSKGQLTYRDIHRVNICP